MLVTGSAPQKRPSLADEEFVRLPWRITEALRRGELSGDEYQLLVYLVAKLAHERPEDGVLVTSLAVLKAETGFTKTQKRLGQVLQELQAKGWITVETHPGSWKWSLRLSGAAVREKQPFSEKNSETEAPDFQVAGKRGEPPERADPHGKPENAVSNLETGLPLEVEVEEETKLSTRWSSREPHRAGKLEAGRPTSKSDGRRPWDMDATAEEEAAFLAHPVAADVAPFVDRGRALREAEALASTAGGRSAADEEQPG
jgi:hypothetical protein